MAVKYLALFFVLALLFTNINGALRWHDQEMLKTHHNEPYQGNAQLLTVHLIPHSHDDVGWLKTVDDYFYGGDMKTQFAGVQYTIDTVVSELSQNREYTFSIVEMAFLYRWWNQATDRQKQQMKTLVANGQLKFLNAGWCMSDEAGMYYQDFVDQITVGLRWLKDTLGYTPYVAWHIDPFGHHSASASLFSQMGYQAFMFSRIDYQDKKKRLDQKSMEMIWRPFQYSGDKSTNIFTQVNYYHYSPPPGFCFDDVCRDEPIKDDPTLEDYNVDVRSDKFVNYFKSMANHYRTANLMHTLGEDFQYTNSRMWYKNVDKLIKYINSKPEYKMKVIYSDPQTYISAIQKQQASYPVKTDDFFPYADNNHSMWTGYFTSRVALKGLVRDFGRYLQAVRRHISELKIDGTSFIVKNSPKQVESTIFGMEMAQGILQHHDAVAGTAKQRVTDNYVATALKSIKNFNNLYSKIKAEEIKNQIGESVNAEDIYINLFWNQTGAKTGLSSKLSSGKTVLISFYNPGQLNKHLTRYPIRIRVPPTELNIVASDNSLIQGDVVCNDLRDSSNCQLMFNLAFAPSSNTYIKLVPVQSGGSAKKVQVKELTIVEQIKQFNLGGNDKVRFVRGNQTFDLSINGRSQNFKIFYNYYEGWDNKESFPKETQPSGAYIFRPIDNTPKQYSVIRKSYYADGLTHGIIILEGDKTITRVYFSKIPDYVRIFGCSIETFVDSIPVTDGKGKEVTLNIKTNYKNNKIFYTDSMGLQEQKRVVDFRPTWKYQVYEPVSGNYYPVNGFIRVQDVSSGRSMYVLNDRAQGGTSMREGQIQLMIHRRLLKDDWRGVQEPLDQKQQGGVGLKQLVRHYLVFSQKGDNSYRKLQKINDQRILPSFVVSSSQSFSSVKLRPSTFTNLESFKLYLRPFEDGSYLLRLHNIDPASSQSVTLPDGWKIEEYTLGYKQLKSEWKSKQLKWKEESNEQQIETLEKRLLQEENVLVYDDSTVEGQTIDFAAFEMKAFKIRK